MSEFSLDNAIYFLLYFWMLYSVPGLCQLCQFFLIINPFSVGILLCVSFTAQHFQTFESNLEHNYVLQELVLFFLRISNVKIHTWTC